MDSQNQGLAGSLQIRSAYSTQVKMGVPVEIVDDESHPVLSGEQDRQNTDEAMEMIEADHMEASHLAHTIPAQLSALSSSIVSHLTTAGLERQLASAAMGVPSSQLSSVVGGGGGGGGGGGTDMDGGRLSSGGAVTVGQQALAHFQQQQQQRRRSPALTSSSSSSANQMEMTPESLAQAESLITQMVKAAAAGSGGNMALEVRRTLASMNFGDLDMAASMTSDPTMNMSPSMRTAVNSMLNDGSGGGGDDPSSPESNFDSSDLLNMTMLQQDDVTARLVAAGPIGVAAAAAVMTSRKRKRSHTFESNPAIRKRHCSKLLRKLKDLIEELSARVGLQAVVLTYRPGKTLDPKEDPTFKVFGAAPLTTVVRNHRDTIVADMETALTQQVHLQSGIGACGGRHKGGGVGGDAGGAGGGEALHELPPLVFDGIPTPVNKMTQAQLRAFIPNMLKFSTGRGKPGWGKDDMKPPWWPEEVAWANVRSDTRTEEQKKALTWTDALRKIVLSCYQFHNRVDLLPDASSEGVGPQLDDLQMMQMGQQEDDGGGGGGEGAEGVATLAEVAASSNHHHHHHATSSDLMGGDSQQVFTIDTGIGNCDTSGMPTLADATLAEAAARLQQMADETGQVQYATQTVTVTERDAKALGQPVGTTTTVLLTAYPGGHSGSGIGTPDNSQQYLSPPPSNSPTHVPNVQVVYNASHIDDIPDSIVSTISPDQMGLGGASQSGHHHHHHHLGHASSEYLTPTTSDLIIAGGGGDSRSSRGGLSDAHLSIGAQLSAQGSVSSANITSHLSATGVSHDDIAAQLISEYTNSTSSKHGVRKNNVADGHQRMSSAL